MKLKTFSVANCNFCSLEILYFLDWYAKYCNMFDTWIENGVNVQERGARGSRAGCSSGPASLLLLRRRWSQIQIFRSLHKNK